MQIVHSAFLAASLVCVVAASTRAVDPPAAEKPDPRRPSAIATQDVPPVPPQIFSRLAQYRNIRGAGFAGWDPAGRGMLVRTNLGNTAQLFRVYEPGGRREQITFLEEPVRGRFLPTKKAERVVLSLSGGGSENDQFYLLDRSTFETKLLTDGKSRHTGGPFRRDGSQLVFGSNRRNGKDTDLFLLDLEKPSEPKLLLEVTEQFWSATDWSPDGKTLLLERYVSANESYGGLLDIESKKLTDLPLPGKAPLALGAMAFSRDGKSIYLTSDASGEFLQLARFDLATKQYEWITQDIPWDVASIEVDRETDRLAFTVNEDGAGRLYVLEKGKRREIKLPLGVVSGIEFSPDGKSLGLTLAQPQLPVDAYSVSLESGELTRWTFSEAGGLNPAKFVAPKRIRFPSFDGREIPAYVYPPPTASAKKKAPVLIQIHGGPESQYQPFLSGTTQYLVSELGIAVIHPNVRGSSGYGKTYLKLDNGMLREDSVKDIGALLDWISKQEDLDATKVAVSGGSYGGFMVLSSLTHYPDRIAAGIDIVGIANFLTFLESTAAYRRDLRRPEYGDERKPEMREFLQKISPATSSHKIKSALMVAHGKNDPRVPIGEAEQIAAKVRAAGKPVWTVFAANEGHGFAKRENSDYLQAVEVMFLMKHLLPNSP